MRIFYAILLFVWICFPCFSQTEKKINIEFSSLYPQKGMEGTNALSLLSCDRSINSNLSVGGKIGCSRVFKQDFAQEKLAEVYLSGTLPMFDSKYFFMKSSFGIGYYGNKTSQTDSAFVDLDLSIHIKPLAWFYMGYQKASVILFSGKNIDYTGFVLGVML